MASHSQKSGRDPVLYGSGSEVPGLSQTPGRSFEAALRIEGGESQDDESQRDFRLDRSMNAAQAVTVVCRRLLDSLVANEDGVRRDLDPEFLHDFRVASRRTRSTLAQIGNALPAASRYHFRREFKWLGTVTGAVRDLDVHLLRLEDYCSNLPEASDHLASLTRYLRRQRAAELERLTMALSSKRYGLLVDNWRATLDAPPPDPSLVPLARRPVLRVASKRIWRAYRRVRKHARAIAPDSPAESLHDLRMDCKELRYLLEFFRSLYDTGEIGRLVRALKKLQDNLGDFNDHEVQQMALQRFAHELQGEGLASVDCLLAMGRLVDHHHRHQRKERRRFAQCFARFDDPGNRECFRRLFNSPAARKA